MTAMSEAYEQMTDTAEQAMDMYDQIAEWCAVLESCAESTDHPYQHQKLTEIAEHLRRLRARQREEDCDFCNDGESPDEDRSDTLRIGASCRRDLIDRLDATPQREEWDDPPKSVHWCDGRFRPGASVFCSRHRGTRGEAGNYVRADLADDPQREEEDAVGRFVRQHVHHEPKDGRQRQQEVYFHATPIPSTGGGWMLECTWCEESLRVDGATPQRED